MTGANVPLRVGGAGTLQQQVIQSAKGIDLTLPAVEEDIPSDHISFMRGGLPEVILTTPDFSVIHTPGDTVEKISARPLEQAVAVALRFLDDAAKASLK
ncbi:MAG: M28 family peptidase [Dehalococcoidia bacterium]|nr:M28 family peptidase [Dehalococcoidia bacterium]